MPRVVPAPAKLRGSTSGIDRAHHGLGAPDPHHKPGFESRGWVVSIVILPSARWAAAGQNSGEGRVFERAFKRSLDLTASSIGLVVLLPICLLIAAAVYLDNPGPVLYSQIRVGINRRRGTRRNGQDGRTPAIERRKADTYGRPFKIYKFRSMINDAERATGPVWASAQDARVTRVGKFLRRARLDEIPQLWNVMLGDMALVGPRPERPTFVQSLSVSIPDYPKRCSALPGITGLAQVKSRYDTSVDSANRKLQYDLYYLKNGRLLLDLKIMAATVKVMARGEGAH
jgi:lipopolysaccharide/colanic/teichoic acid biosynthesis glycosyltransferase